MSNRQVDRLKKEKQELNDEYKLLKEHAVKLEKMEFFARAAAISWDELTKLAKISDVWKAGIKTVRQPGEGNESRPFFVKVSDGIAVLKFMPKGCSAPVQIADEILRLFGVRTPRLRFILPADEEIATIRAGMERLQATINEQRMTEMMKTLDVEKVDACLEALSQLGRGGFEAVMVLEYVKAGRIDDQLRSFDSHDEGFANVEKLLEVMGEMLVADLLIYNLDRFSLPGVWDHPGNYGNILATSSLKAVSVDHQVFSDVPAATHAINLPKVEDVLRRLASADLANTGETARLQPIASMLHAICGDRFAGAEAYIIFGALKGIALAANFPRPWNPADAEPGLWAYLHQWQREWAVKYPTLPFVDDAAFEALKARVRTIHETIYPVLLANANVDVHAVLQDVYSRVVPLPAGRERNALRPIRRNPVTMGRWTAVAAVVKMGMHHDEHSAPSTKGSREVLSFIESSFSTRAEYEAWRQHGRQHGRQQA